MFEYGDVFSTGSGGGDAAVWTQERAVMGTRLITLCASQSGPLIAAVTEGVRLAAPGFNASQRERPRLDRDIVRWIRGGAVGVASAAVRFAKGGE